MFSKKEALTQDIPKKIQVLLLTLFLGCILFFLDWLVFRKLYFLFPNEMEWDTSPWYNFLHYTEKIPGSEEPQKILIAGSSVALYSVLPEKINLGEDWKVYFYSHVAMAPTDLYYYTDKILSLKPQIVVYVLNPADLQLEYVEEREGFLYYDYPAWLRHFSWRHPLRIFYPGQFSWDLFRGLDRKEIYRLWGKACLYANRYREFFWDPIDTYLERHFRSGRSYHIYTGSMPKEGIWQHGWTTKQFTLDCELPPASPSEKSLARQESVFLPSSDTFLTIWYEDGRMEKIHFPKSGWHSLTFHLLPSENREEKTIQALPGSVKIRIETDKPYSSRLAENKPYGKEYEYGIRLSQNFCKNRKDRNFSYKRPRFLEEERFQNMGLEEYKKDYYERLYRDAEKRPELTRMRALAKAKEILSRQDFATWIEIERIPVIRERLEKEGVQFLIVLSPENPLELAKYGQGSWYSGFLDYLGETSRGHFYDFSRFFPDPRYFSDPHHLTYEGAKKFTKALEEILREEIEYGD